MLSPLDSSGVLDGGDVGSGEDVGSTVGVGVGEEIADSDAELELWEESLLSFAALLHPVIAKLNVKIAARNKEKGFLKITLLFLANRAVR